MSATTGFILAAALLVLAILAILLLPLWRAPRASSAIDRRQANLDIFRDQLGELERERSAGALAEADFEQAKTELQRRLLEEVQPEAVAQERTGGRKTALALLIAIPLAATAGYLILGKPEALDPLQTQARVSPQQIESMLGNLVEKLKANPDDSKGWVMLARSYKVLGRFAESAEAYSHGGALVDAEPVLLADYAEVLAQTQGGSFDGKPGQLIARALKIDPDEPQALFLAGTAASERKDFSAVAEYWGRLLPQLEPGSEEAETLAAAVTKAREIAAQMNEKTGIKEGSVKLSKEAAARKESISGEVTISGKVASQARPDDLLFVFARAEEGSRMPLAVMRTRVADLPLTFRFDDSMVLPGGKKISEFRTVSLEARVAKAGKAQSSSGDLFGSIKGIKPGSKNNKLVIDQVQP
ncbi:MAG: c-type cytochrome biogenesis protein CcmI [Propionivibrio sp.]|uniref:c-type cytochrome biogenesis protein CcmI n=1 Tax=Propionivibrio sp. TaxID=2212460 RepID=UPI001A64354B|nr:c-type cytochrome biogenesis protein CcmI [Propionivibrio sp.]MBL8413708.1 c-type cytochrome biogenesis protein CcmI [Propionivibrio sp.]